MAKPAPGSKMNTRAEPVEGGPPMTDKAVRGNRDLNRMAGEEDRPRGRALELRQRNIEGHNEATRKAMKEIKLSQLKAAAEKPGASRYAKDRYKFAKQTGMVGNAKGGSVKKMAKGGSVSKRADGIARKGKTKGRMV